MSGPALPSIKSLSNSASWESPHLHLTKASKEQKAPYKKRSSSKASGKGSLLFQGPPHGSTTIPSCWSIPSPEFPESTWQSHRSAPWPPAQFLRALQVLGIGESTTGHGLMFKGRWYQSKGGKTRGSQEGAHNSHYLRTPPLPPRLPRHGNTNRAQ